MIMDSHSPNIVGTIAMEANHFGLTYWLVQRIERWHTYLNDCPSGDNTGSGVLRIALY